jgi:hypothetical protein
MPTIDYDAFERERAAAGGEPVDPLLFRPFPGGKEYRLPDEIPATIVLDAVRLRHAPLPAPQDHKTKGAAAQAADAMAKEARTEQLVFIGDALVGPENFREILATRDPETGMPMPAGAIGRLVMAMLGAISGGGPEETRPNRATRRAQKAST